MWKILLYGRLETKKAGTFLLSLIHAIINSNKTIRVKKVKYLTFLTGYNQEESK